MAIGSAAQWEVRPTTGDNTNGAGFNATLAGAGTDYSQQATAQLSLTDLATPGAGSTTLTSATGGFTAAMLGNALRINTATGNFAIGWYFLTGYTDTNTVTLDRTPTAAGAGVSGSGKLGGATKSLSGQTTVNLCNNAGGIVAGNTVWVKNEAWSEVAVVSRAGTNLLPVILEGYNTTRGDAPTGSDRPHNNRAGASGIALTVSGNWVQVRWLWLSHVGNTHGVSSAGAYALWQGCRSSNHSGSGFLCSATTTFVQCEMDTNTFYGVSESTLYTRLLGCWVHHNTPGGINIAGVTLLQRSLITANTGPGIWVGTGTHCVVLDTVVHGNTGATTDGLVVSTGVQLYTGVIQNCIFSANGRDGIRATDAGSMSSVLADYNCFYGNGGAARTNIASGPHDVAVDPQFVDAANGNFAIGTNLKALGWPGTFPGGLTTGYTDIGAAQRQEPAAGLAGQVIGSPFIKAA